MSAQPTTARTTGSGRNQTIKLAKDGKFHLTVSQFQDIVVNVPPTFSQAGLFLVAAQAPNGTMNVGLTDKFNIGDLKPIEDVNRLFGIRKIISGPETVKEKAENKINLQNMVYRLAKKESLEYDQIWVRSSLDTEFLRIQTSSMYLEDALNKVASFNDVHESDRLFRKTICILIQGCLMAQVGYLQTFVGETEKEKLPLGHFLLEAGVPSWFYNRFALQKFDHPRDKPMWTIFFRSSLEKSFVLTLEEALHDKVKSNLELFPGVLEVQFYASSIEVHQDDKEALKKSKLIVPPRGFEKNVISDIKPARPPVDLTRFKDETLIWNSSRFGLLGVSNPNGDRVALWKQLYGVDVDEKFSPQQAMLDTKVTVLDLYKNPTENMVVTFMEKIGIPARLMHLVKAKRRFLFPTKAEWDETLKIEAKEDGVPLVMVPYKMGIQFTSEFFPEVLQEEILAIKRDNKFFISSLIKTDRDRDDYKSFMSSSFYERTFGSQVKKKAVGMPNSALTKTALTLVKKIGGHDKFSFMTDQVKIYLGSFIDKRLMDIAAVEISNRLANYDEEIFFDEDNPPIQEEAAELNDF